jgi:FAD binding domain
MAFQAGAAEEGLGILELVRTSQAGPESGRYLGLTAVQPDLWVNAQGERFCDESITFVDTSMGNANARQKDGSTYTIFDNTIKLALIDKGITKSMSPDLLPGSRLVDLDRELEAALNNEGSGVHNSGSVGGLGEQIGVDPGVLQATVEEYNNFCQKGHDDLFAKDRRYLRPVNDPPFYAIKARTTCLGTLGGIKINHKTEVIDKKGKIIPGLYATGCDAGGMYGDGYSIKESSGLASAFATNSGRIAGRNALAFIKKI